MSGPNECETLGLQFVCLTHFLLHELMLGGGSMSDAARGPYHVVPARKRSRIQ